jgi:prolyl 4-hydroxylase
MNLKDFIKVYDNVLSAEICNRIIKEFEARKSLVKHYDTDLYKFDQLDLNQTDLKPLAMSFVRQVIPYIKNYCEELNVEKYIKIKGFEDVRIKKYIKKSSYEFKTHVDVDDKESAVRHLIFILYLNDNNGETFFPMLNYSYKPKQGSMIMFPPFWMYPHSGGIPTDNDKYIMMSCLHYT